MEEHKTQAGKPEEQVFYDAFNASPIGIAVENLEGQPLFVNPAFCSFLGFSDEELRNKHCVDFSPREDAEKDWALFQQLRAGMIDHYQLEKRYFQRDGSLVWGRLIISLLKSRPSPLVLAMVEDITDKKKAEEARFRHAAVVESSDDAIASATLDGIIVSWNTGAQKIYGYTEAEAVGKPVNMLVPPELPDEENKILEMLRAGGRILHFETVRVTKTGKRINVALTISPIKDSSGRTVGCSGIARDISERKLAEEALRASEERLRLAQQAAGIGTFDWNIRTGVNTWTRELEAMYGLPLGGFGGTQAAFENLVHPDDRAGVIKLVDAAMKSGQPTKGEWRVVWADGSVHWIAGCWQVFMDASGEPSKMIGVNIDVTERKRAEEGLRQKERELSEAQRLAQIGSWEWDPDTDTVNWSRELYRITGRDPNLPAASYKEHSQILSAESWERLQRNVEEALRSGTPYEVDLEYVHPDGSTIWARARSEAKRDTAGRIVGLRGTAQDITERKLAETELSLAHDRLRLAMEAGKSVGWDRDVKSGRDSLFGDLQSIFGIPSQVCDGRVGDFDGYLHPEDRVRVMEALDDAMRTKKPYAAEFRILRPDGTVRWLAARGKFYYSLEGEPERMLGTAVDITERKLAEEALSTVSQKLIEAHEEERTRIARELHDDVGQRLVLLAWQLGSSKGDLRKEVEDLANDVQALSHELHSPKLDYLGLAAAAAGFCKELSDRQRVEIEFHSENISKELPKEISLCLFRVLQEALQNAIKHSGSRQFHASLTGGANEIELTVHDSGVGFEPEEAIKGCGLGLTSMQERLKLVQGKLSIDSKPQRGTTIHARVPVIPKTMSAGAVG